ncbi:MAG: BF3164 family lipoprotein [Candidatus Cryptobacteroides sp.]
MKPISGERLQTELPLLNPRSIHLAEDQLFIIDKYDGKHLTQISLNDLKCQRVLNVGNGPNEYIRIETLCFNSTDRHVKIYDSVKRVISSYRYDNPLSLSEETLEGVADAGHLSNMGAYSLAMIGDSYVANGTFGDMMFALLDSEMNIIQIFGVYPGDNEGIGSPEFFLKNQTFICADEQTQSFVAAGVYNDWLAFYQNIDGQLCLVKEYFGYDSNLITASNSSDGITHFKSQENSDTMRGYRALYSSGEYIYALYWGIRSERMLDSDNNCYILKFTNDGKYKEGFVIKGLLRSFVVDEKNNSIYAISFSQTEDEVIIKYEF